MRGTKYWTFKHQNQQYSSILRRLFIVGLTYLLLTGCSTFQNKHSSTGKPLTGVEVTIPINVNSNPARAAMRRGIDAIISRDAKHANNEFNLALAQDMKSAGLHVANALAYQIRARTGEPELFNLAETGYLIALELQHDLQSAALQLAHLYLEHKRYTEAQQAVIYSLKLDPMNVEAIYLLANASYNIGDIDLALWAIDQARRYAPSDELGARMLPVIYAAAGLTDEASAFIDEKQNIFNEQMAKKQKQRVEQWKRIYDNAKLSDTLYSKTKTHTDDKLSEASSFDSSMNESDRNDLGPLSYSWSDCGQELANSGNDFQSGGSTEQGDETTPMPSLPSPCMGRNLPKMASIDVVILRTNEFSTNTNGINLLQNLAVTLQQTANQSTTSNTGVPTTTTTVLSTDVGLGTSAGSAIAYSLNISNATKQTTEVVARPSLLVLDRQPAQFFSGSSVSIGLAGSDGAASSLERVSIGVSLSVTPTFINDSELLLNVKAARSFFEPITGSSTFAQSIQTSRNMVSAATRVKFNETLVLSGLTENVQTSGSTGVPILKDIPGISYFFSRKTKQSFNKTVLVLITPKHVIANDEPLEKINNMENNNKKEPKMLRETRKVARKSLEKNWPGFYQKSQHLSPKDRAFSTRMKDIQLDDWEQPSRIQALLQDAVDYQ